MLNDNGASIRAGPRASLRPLGGGTAMSPAECPLWVSFDRRRVVLRCQLFPRERHDLSPIKFGPAQLVGELVEHGIDHAGLIVVDEGVGDIDIFRHHDPSRHIGPAGKLVGAGAQHRA